MIELFTQLGETVAPRILLPLGVWTALAVVAEGVFRTAFVPAALRLPVRQTLLFALVPAMLTPFAAAALAPAVEGTIVASGLAVLELPAVTVGAPQVAAGPAWTVWTLAGGVLLLALCAAVLALVRLGAVMVRLHRHRRTLVPAGAAWLADAREVAAETGLPRVPALARSSGASPYTVGLRHPVVVLPDGLGDAERRLALAHEFAHVRRRDYGWTLAERAAVALCAAHPLAHLVAGGAALDRECLVDADVLRWRPQQGRAYADLLLRLTTCPTPPLALGAAFSPLKHRLVAMNRSLSDQALRRTRLTGRALAGCLAAVLVLAGFSTTADADGSFRVVNPTVELGGVETTFSGSVSTDALGVFGIDVPGFGRFLLSPEPFIGSTPVGFVSGNRLTTAIPDHWLFVTSAEPILDLDENVPLHTRFDAHPDAKPLAPGFALSMGVSRTADGMTRTFDSSDPRKTTRTPSRMAPPAPGLLRPDTTEVFEVVDQQPEMIGGLRALQEAVVYPEVQRQAGIEGRAFVQFVVTPAGGVRDAAVTRSSGDDALDAAALAAVRSVRFRPSMQDGEAVAVRYAVPISFRLGNGAAPPSPPDAPAPPDAPTPPDAPAPPSDGSRSEMQRSLDAIQRAVAYPPLQRQAGIEGQTRVRFTVAEDGTARDLVLERSSGDSALDAAAMTAVRSGDFSPRRRIVGRPTQEQFSIPITFELPDRNE